MPHNMKRKLILVAIFTNVFRPANLQFAVPYMAQPAVYAVPAPVPVAVAIQLPDRKTTRTTTTTTTPEPPGIAIAVPVPVPMPFAVPAPPPPAFCQARQRPQGCPPCPPCVCLPSCTPAFFSFCSPCHQRCRCRSPDEAPVPMPPPGLPYPVPMPAPVGPPPVMVVPVPPVVRVPDFQRSSSFDDSSYSRGTSSDTSSDTSRCGSSCESNYIRRKRKYWRRRRRRRRRPYYRRQFNDGDENEGSGPDFAKPVLSYVSDNGHVKYEAKLSKNDALKMIGEGNTKQSDRKQTVNVVAGDDSVVVSTNNRKTARRYDKVLLRNSPTNHVLKDGNNQLIFKPPSNKQIKNVAVSFQVT